MNAGQRKKIIFVCTGNTCRSPMAEAICRSELRRIREEEVEVISAGLSVTQGGLLNGNSAIVLAENGLSLENFNSTPLTDEAVSKAYAVVCMTESQRNFLVENRALAFFKSVGKCGSLGENIHSFYSLVGYEIPDPFGRDLNCYRETFERIAKAMPEVLEKLGIQAKSRRQEITQEKKESFLDLGEKPVEKEVVTAPKKRGRPKKNPTKTAEEGAATPKKRGRPKKKQE